MPSIPAITEPLSDGVVALRPIAERDIPEILIAYQDDPSMHLSLGAERPPSGAELGRICEQTEVERLAGVAISLTILEAGHDTCRGQVTVHRLDWEHIRGELGVWLAPQARGRGYAPRALRLVVRWLFEAVRLERVDLRTGTDNEPMLRAAAAAGFTNEGVLRGFTLEHGRRVDNVVLSVLPGELS